METVCFKCSAYIAALFIEKFKVIRDSVLEGDVPDYITAFREPIGEMRKVGQPLTEVRSCVYSVLHMVPRVDKKTRSAIWHEVSAALCPKKSGNRKPRDTWADNAELDRLIIQTF